MTSNKKPLCNAATPQHIPTYDGSNQSTHPSVLYFKDGWHGYAYWMAMTPYPFNNDGFEDPSLLVSQDGEHWEAPQGVQNPLTPAPPRPGHNCDTDLVYVPTLDELRIYYVEADDIVQSWVKLMRSTDGVNWTKPEIVVHDPAQKYSILSPSIEILADGSYAMWYVDTGNTGYVNQCNRIRLRTSADGITWSEQKDYPELFQPDWQIWHIDMYYEPATGELHAMYPAYPNGGNCDDCSLFYAVKRPDEEWTTFAAPIIAPAAEGAWDDFCIYRSSMLLDREADTLRVWYGAKKKSDASWNMGYVENSYSAFLEAFQ